MMTLSGYMDREFNDIRGRSDLSPECLSGATPKPGDGESRSFALIPLIREISSTHSFSSDFAKPIARSRASSSCHSKSGDRLSPDRQSRS